MRPTTARTLVTTALVFALPLTTRPARADATSGSPARLTARLETAGAFNARPIADTGARLVVAAPDDVAASASTTAQGAAKRNGCGLRLVLGGAIGAVAGAGSAVALLASTGGSDSTRQIVTKFTVLGTGLGLLAGLITCAG